jgi:CRP/FNR family transcriptional regulator, cyclic AMP receptor protein
MQTMYALETLIREHPFLSDLDPKFYRFFHDCASIRRFASQQLIFQEGGAADHFYLIINGSVKLETFVPGCGMVSIQTLKSAEALGWSWFFPPYKWHFTAATREPTEVISLDALILRDNASQDLEFHNELITRVAQTLYQRLLSTREHLVDLYGIRP